jgi:hypothetical protein
MLVANPRHPDSASLNGVSFALTTQRGVNSAGGVSAEARLL